MKKVRNHFGFMQLCFYHRYWADFTATILQARLISSDGDIEVLGTFTKIRNKILKI